MIFVLQGLVETINQMTPAILKVVVVYLFSDHDIQLATTEQSRKLARDGTMSVPWGSSKRFEQESFLPGNRLPDRSRSSGSLQEWVQRSPPNFETVPKNWKIMSSKKVKAILSTNNSGIPGCVKIRYLEIGIVKRC